MGVTLAKLSAMKKRVIVLFTFILILIVGFYLYRSYVANSYKSPIAIEQIPEVLRINHDPVLPKWEIETSEKYDDGFISPSVIITYKNGVVIHLSSNGMDLSNQFEYHERKAIGSRQPKFYSNEKKIGYVFEAGIGYAIISPKNLLPEVEKFIQDFDIPQEITKYERSTVTLGNIHLRDSLDKVVEVLGGKFTELGGDEARVVQINDVVLHVNRMDNTVARIIITGPNPYLTDTLGVQIGHSYTESVKKYETNYPTYKGIKSASSQIFFEVEPGIIMMLSSEINNGNGTKVTDKVTEIMLTYAYVK